MDPVVGDPATESTDAQSSSVASTETSAPAKVCELPPPMLLQQCIELDDEKGFGGA